MKKSYLKRGKSSLKKSKLSKQGKQKISVVQRKLWELCKEIIRKKYGNTCYTCGRTSLIGSDWQTGHMFSKASVGAFLKYDLRILRPQCMTCNIWQGGRGADFYARMLKEIGEEAMQKLQADRKVSVKALDHYLKLIPEYQELLKEVNCKK